MKVKLRKGQLAHFRTKARSNPKEIYAYLVGTVDTANVVTIERFAYPELATQTANEVAPTIEGFEKIEAAATKDGFRIVGSIHSHPNWWPVMSRADHESHITEGHRISGVCGVMARRTKVYFWLAESSLPCKIEYI